MKKLLIGLLTIGTISANASTSCFEQYQEAAELKSTQNSAMIDKAENRANLIAPVTASSVVYSFFNPTLLPSALAFGTYQLANHGVAMAFEIANLVGSKEDRALDYASKAENIRGFMKKTFKQARKIKPNVKMDEIKLLVEEGFQSGDFCAEKKLMGPKQIREYVLERI